MCVICHAAKKKYMKREELAQAMRNNNAGFFLADIRKDGKRDVLRTLDEKMALAFFDKVPEDDALVVHARIPSRGEKTLDNVHGWTEDGISFCHNMTLTQLEDMMKGLKWELTDSEFFFRKLFIPYMRGLGKKAYADGRFCPELDAFVRHFCGSYNKFCFIMPDGVVLRYGQWVSEKDRKEGDKVMFHASNTSYKVFERAWPEPIDSGARFQPAAFPAVRSPVKPDYSKAVDAIVSSMGFPEIVRAALAAQACAGVADAMNATIPSRRDFNFGEPNITSFVPDWVNDIRGDVYDMLCEEPKNEKTVFRFADRWAGLYAEANYLDEFDLLKGFCAADGTAEFAKPGDYIRSCIRRDVAAMTAMFHVAILSKQTDPLKFAKAYVMRMEGADCVPIAVSTKDMYSPDRNSLDMWPTVFKNIEKLLKAASQIEKGKTK